MKGRSFPPLEASLALAVVLVTGICSSIPFPVHGQGLRDFADGWLMNPHDMAFILSSSGPRKRVDDDRIHLPEDGNGWGLWAGAGQGRLFSMKDLTLKSAECGIVRKGGALPWSLACSWDRLGEKLMVEETGVLRLRVGDNPQAGIRVRARHWLVEGEQVAACIEPDLEGRLSFEIGASFTGNAAFWLHPGRLPAWHGRGGRRTLVELKLFHPGIGVGFRIDQRNDGQPILSLEIMGSLTSGLGLGVRADPETGSMGGTLVVRMGGGWLHTSHLVHPALGVTHRFHLGAGDPEASVW